MKNIFLVILYPLIVVTAPIWIILLATELYFLPQEWWLRRKMKKSGRLIKPQALQHMDSGTLIIDRPTFNWGLSRIWFTRDAVLDLSPVPPPDPKGPDPENATWHPHFRWVHEKYTSPESGAALLLHVWHGEKRLKGLIAKNPHLRLLPGFSGGESYQVFARQVGANPDPSPTRP